jgi:hypothetical protein
MEEEGNEEREVFREENRKEHEKRGRPSQPEEGGGI